MASKFGGAGNNTQAPTPLEEQKPTDTQDQEELQNQQPEEPEEPEAPTAATAPTPEQMLQDPQKAIQAGAQNSLSSLQSLALASLEAASHPFSGMLEEGDSGEVQQRLPAGYYSVYAGRVQLSRMKWLEPTGNVGGRFFYALDDLSEEAKAALDKLVARGTAELVEAANGDDN